MAKQSKSELTPEPSPPPEHLSDRSKRIWGDVVPRRCRSPERIVLLQAALEALDRAEEARVAIQTAGMTTTTKRSGAVHVHPLVRVERESRQQFAAIWDRLGLQFCGDIDGRTNWPDSLSPWERAPIARNPYASTPSPKAAATPRG